MPLRGRKEVLKLKLSSVPQPALRALAKELGVDDRGTATQLIVRLLESDPDERKVDDFIRGEFKKRLRQRRTQISDDELKAELRKVSRFSWGVEQGQLDRKIQSNYVRKFFRYEELLESVKARLHNDVTDYVLCSWFNYWTTVLIEDHVALHRRVVPTVKHLKGVDIFFDGQPFDLKVSYLPGHYNVSEALSNPIGLAKWMYENQGAQRFGPDNRLFVVVLDKERPERSWELKRDFDLVFRRLDEFLDREDVSDKDEIAFTFRKRTYTAVSKVLIISK